MKEKEKKNTACNKYELELQYLTTMLQTVDLKYKTLDDKKTKENAKIEEKLNIFLKSQDATQKDNQILEWFKKEKVLEGKIEKEQQEVKRLEALNY